MKNYAKLSARAALTGNYIEPAAAVIIMLIFLLLTVLLNQLSAKMNILIFTLPVSVLILSVFMCVLKFSLSARLLEISEKSIVKTKISKKRAAKGSLLAACVSGLKLLHFIAFSSLPLLYSAAVYMRVRLKTVSVASLILNLIGAVILIVMSLLFCGVSVQKYSKAIYYFAGSEAVTVRNAISMSVAQTKGKLLDIFIFKCSFLPWLLSGILLLPLMFVLPYYEESFIFYCMYSRK